MKTKSFTMTFYDVMTFVKAEMLKHEFKSVKTNYTVNGIEAILEDKRTGDKYKILVEKALQCECICV
jgi:hypothetical protein